MPSLPSFVFSADLPDGKSWLCIVSRRSYRLAPGRRAEPTSDPPPLQLAPELRASSAYPDEAILVAETDLFAAIKPMTDVVLEATAHSHRGAATSLDTGLEIGRTQKVVRVCGRRRITLGANAAIAFTPPERFEHLALSWEDAYGGCDADSERAFAAQEPRREGDIEGSLAYPRNRVGRGYWMDRERGRLDGEVLPRLEDPTDPILPERMLARDDLDWIDRPRAAGYGPIDMGTFPRAWFFLPAAYHPPTRPIHEVATGALSMEDIVGAKGPSGPADFRMYNAAPTNQAMTRLTGSERVKLWNLHPKHELLEFDLPADRPRFFVEPPGAGRRELQAELGTVLVEPELDRVTLTWGARLEVFAAYEPEACEAMPASATFPR